ncbi:hypothetical protein A3A36_02880 [Candidatus Kaiserbacteria bacterium RIFCSPLOWO2_01_FULL_52_12b]|uniref:Type II secretion system protein GspI C-terminal domain-containing protein n=1 Tax=Candidatus Kaiserbacteria bacterium RIFCSPLOWO2_01_FULL_52_12b TaxID=1798509 RepID=A0A1F6EWW4_9BACT|nr:MAG: hypothetical protein A3A36_02880 [Candidatus Kaiserbacteria bacterium RIFCSPLOWO2_01_FULL_52_12b]
MSIKKITRGFSLVEILVTLFILGTMLVISQAIFLGAPVIQGAKNQDLALKIARNEVEVLRALGYTSLPVSSSFTDSLLSSLSSGSGALVVSDFNLGTKQVVVTVSWMERGVAESVSLTTLITKAGGLP